MNEGTVLCVSANIPACRFEAECRMILFCKWWHILIRQPQNYQQHYITLLTKPRFPVLFLPIQIYTDYSTSTKLTPIFIVPTFFSLSFPFPNNRMLLDGKMRR